MRKIVICQVRWGSISWQHWSQIVCCIFIGKKKRQLAQQPIEPLSYGIRTAVYSSVNIGRKKLTGRILNSQPKWPLNVGGKAQIHQEILVALNFSMLSLKIQLYLD